MGVQVISLNIDIDTNVLFNNLSIRIAHIDNKKNWQIVPIGRTIKYTYMALDLIYEKLITSERSYYKYDRSSLVKRCPITHIKSFSRFLDDNPEITKGLNLYIVENGGDSTNNDLIELYVNSNIKRCDKDLLLNEDIEYFINGELVNYEVARDYVRDVKKALNKLYNDYKIKIKQVMEQKINNVPPIWELYK